MGHGHKTGHRANRWIEGLSRTQLDAYAERGVLAALMQAQAEVPFYRWFYDKNNVRVDSIRTLAEFHDRVPLVSKADYIEFQGLPGWDPFDSRVRQFHLTSGTSGAGREIHVRTENDLISMGVGWAYQFLWAGLQPGERLLITMPFIQTLGGPCLQAACEAAGLVPVNAFGTAHTEDRVEQIYRFKVGGIVGTPSYLHRMTLTAQAQGRKPATDLPSLRALFVSGESFSVNWAKDTAAFWGATLYESWGATQVLSVMLANCNEGAVLADSSGELRRGVLHGLDHRCYIEVLDPDSGKHVAPGEFGEIVVTTLRTTGLPSIRFRMRDRIRLLPYGSCGCGRSLSCYEVGSIGRVDDMIKMRAMNVWPSAVDDVVFAGPVSDYSGRVYTDDRGREMIELLVEPSEPINDPDTFAADLSAKIRAHVGVSMDVKLAKPGSFREVQFKARRWTDERAVLG